MNDGDRMDDAELYAQVSRYLGQEMVMTAADSSSTEPDAEPGGSARVADGIPVVVFGPDGRPADGRADDGGDDQDQDENDVMAQVEQPAKVMRIGTMIKQLLEEVRAAPLDEAGRMRLREIHRSSIRELEEGLSPDLRDELDRLTLPFSEDSVPSEAELRIAQAQLVGWLEGLFHGIQTALFAQQMAVRAQLEQMRGRALPGQVGPGQVIVGMPGRADAEGHGTGQYL
jgi:proteasome activator-like protein